MTISPTGGSIRCSLALAMTLALATVTHAQRVAQPAPDVRSFNEEQTRIWLSKALANSLPDYTIDDLSFLAVNHPGIVIPVLSDRLESAVRDGSSSEQFVRKVADALAYTSNRDAMEFLAHFSEAGNERFGYYVERSLDYAIGRANPFLLAYDVIESVGPVARERIVKWVNQSASFGDREVELYRAASDRHGGEISDGAIASDPLLSKVSPGIQQALRQRRNGHSDHNRIR